MLSTIISNQISKCFVNDLMPPEKKLQKLNSIKQITTHCSSLERAIYIIGIIISYQILNNTLSPSLNFLVGRTALAKTLIATGVSLLGLEIILPLIAFACLESKVQKHSHKFVEELDPESLD